MDTLNGGNEMCMGCTYNAERINLIEKSAIQLDRDFNDENLKNLIKNCKKCFNIHTLEGCKERFKDSGWLDKYPNKKLVNDLISIFLPILRTELIGVHFYLQIKARSNGYHLDKCYNPDQYDQNVKKYMEEICTLIAKIDKEEIKNKIQE